jgi:hypothetical protein
MLLMAHERIEGLEGFKRKYDALKSSYDAKAAEVSQLQQKLTTQSLGCVCWVTPGFTLALPSSAFHRAG